MHHHTITLKPSTPYHGLPPHLFAPNPSIVHAVFPPISRACLIFSFNSAPKQRPNSLSFVSNCLDDGRLKKVAVKDVDVATLGNLCVDIVLNVPKLPPASFEDRKAYMEELSTSRPDKQYWEAGGNSNMAIAAARLGLRCITIGHVGNEVYGHFLLDVLRDEGIGMVRMSEGADIVNSSSASYETLLCWVLVDPLQRHGFCSRADFSKEPAFSWVTKLSREVKMAIKQSKILFCNGYGFDDLAPGMIISALEYAVEVGTAIFFDPGPRGKSLSTGTPEEQRAIDQFLRMSDVLLLTSDEVWLITLHKLQGNVFNSISFHLRLPSFRSHFSASSYRLLHRDLEAMGSNHGNTLFAYEGNVAYNNTPQWQEPRARGKLFYNFWGQPEPYFAKES